LKITLVVVRCTVSFGLLHVLLEYLCLLFLCLLFLFAVQVGEHLLSLVQELEAFASSDALADILRVRGQARTLANTSSGWQALKKLLQITDVSCGYKPLTIECA